jgi:hypothetical protein
MMRRKSLLSFWMHLEKPDRGESLAVVGELLEVVSYLVFVATQSFIAYAIS